MKKIKVFIVQFIVSVIIILILGIMIHMQGEKRTNEVITLEKGWSITTDGMETYYEEIPSYVETKSGLVCLRRQLTPKDCGNNFAISFYTAHVKIWAMVEGKEIYRQDGGNVDFAKTTGNNLNMFALPSEYAGRMLCIYLESPYHETIVKIPEFSGGESGKLMAHFTYKRVFPFLVSVLMIVTGIMMIAAYFAVLKSYKLEKRLVWLGFFAVSFGVWSVNETQVLIVLTEHKMLLSLMTYIALKMTYTPVIGFFFESFQKKNMLLTVTCYMNALDLIGTSALQMLGIADYKETLWFTHLYMIVGVLYVMGYLIWNVILKRILIHKGENQKLVMTVNSFGIILVSVCVIADFIVYYANTAKADSASFSRIGLLIYIMVLGISLIKESFRLVQVEREAEKIKEEALLDAVTRLANRNALQNDLAEIPREKFGEYGVVMCDLNGLKYFNDHYGHSVGDSYIIIAAELICDSFSGYGKIYRVGGDEFVVLAKDMSKETYDTLYQSMNQKIDALSKSYFEERMGIAAGYALFDPNMDADLVETEKRADAKMYEVKKAMKEANARLRRYDPEMSQTDQPSESKLLQMAEKKEM